MLNGNHSPKCFDGTFAQATQHCANVGARLCTLTEIEDDCAKGTGCGQDSDQVWTSTVTTYHTDFPTPAPTTLPSKAPTISPTNCPKCHWTELSTSSCSATCGDEGRMTTTRTLTLPEKLNWDEATCGKHSDACAGTNLTNHGTLHDGLLENVHDGLQVAFPGLQEVTSVNCTENITSINCPVDCEMGGWTQWGHPTVHSGTSDWDKPTVDIWGKNLTDTEDSRYGELQMERIWEKVSDEKDGGKPCPNMTARIQTKPWVDHCSQILGEEHSMNCEKECINDKQKCTHTANRCSEKAYSRVKVQYDKYIACNSTSSTV